MMSTLTFIYNPQAGPATYSQAIRAIAGKWEGRGWQTAVYPTQYAGHATILASQEALAGRTMVMACGGDGTMGEVADGLAGSDTILAPLPSGTGNSLAKEWGLPRPSLISDVGLMRAADSLSRGRVQHVDVGCTQQGKRFLQWVGVGLDSFLVARMEPRSKMMKRLGPAGYTAQALLTARSFPGMMARVTVDDQTFEGDYLMVIISNFRRYAGGELLLSPDAKLDDGRFEVWLLGGRGIWRYLQLVAMMRQGRHLRDKQVQMARGSQVVIESDPPQSFHTDGDPAGETPFSLQVKPGALRVLVPPTASSDAFTLPGEPIPRP
jgi:diacylglycerol kinase (ATP)